GEYLLGGATSSSFPSQGDPIGSLSGNFEAPHYADGTPAKAWTGAAPKPLLERNLSPFLR
ncbi:hypothetical protein ACFVX4_39655, partial [Streptomyces sp. NPDC058240]